MIHDQRDTLHKLFPMEEVSHPSPSVANLFQRCHGHAIPDYPRHFVLWHARPAGAPKPAAYLHLLALDEVYLAGGMCADSSVYRELPPEVFSKLRDAGGLATMILRRSYGFLGDCPGVFGHVAEPRARQADLRAGMVDTGREHLMVCWLKEVPESEKRRLIDRVAAHGAF